MERLREVMDVEMVTWNKNPQSFEERVKDEEDVEDEDEEDKELVECCGWKNWRAILSLR